MVTCEDVTQEHKQMVNVIYREYSNYIILLKVYMTLQDNMTLFRFFSTSVTETIQHVFLGSGDCDIKGPMCDIYCVMYFHEMD